MKKIKNINGYAIYEAGERDVKKYGFAVGSFYVYFASDIRDFGLSGSTPEFEDCGSIEEAETNCTSNFAIAKEIVEGRTTAASVDEILEVEAQLDAGADPDDVAEADYEDAQREQESIETARAVAKAAGLPFSERLSAGAEDEPDSYTYDGSMTPEDYDAMVAARDAHEALCAAMSGRFPDMDQDTLGKLASTIADSPDSEIFALRAELAERNAQVRKLSNAATDLLLARDRLQVAWAEALREIARLRARLAV